MAPDKQKSVRCKSCGRAFLVPAVDSSRQEVSASLDADAYYSLICPFCMSHAMYKSSELE